MLVNVKCHGLGEATLDAQLGPPADSIGRLPFEGALAQPCVGRGVETTHGFCDWMVQVYEELALGGEPTRTVSDMYVWSSHV